MKDCMKMSSHRICQPSTPMILNYIEPGERYFIGFLQLRIRAFRYSASDGLICLHFDTKALLDRLRKFLSGVSASRPSQPSRKFSGIILRVTRRRCCKRQGVNNYARAKCCDKANKVAETTNYRRLAIDSRADRSFLVDNTPLYA